MAFLKTAITSLGLLLASSAYAQGNGQQNEQLPARAVESQEQPAEISLEQIMEISEQVAWKIAAENNRLQSETEESNDWTMKSLRAGAAARGHYKIPKGFSLRLDGSLEGYGLRLDIEKGDIFGDEMNLNDLFDSDDIPVHLGGAYVSSIFEELEKDKASTGRKVERHFNDLREDLVDIWGDRYSDQLFVDLFVHMAEIMPEYSDDDEMTISEYPEFYQDMEEFLDDFYQEELSSEDKQETIEALDDFVTGMRRITSVALLEHVVQSVYEDPMNEIEIGGETLTELEPLFEDLKPLLTITENDKGLKVEGEISGSGESEISTEFKYDLGEGRLFTQSFSAKDNIDGYARIYFDAQLSKGEPIYVYVTDEEIQIPLETMGNLLGFHLHLLDVDVEGLMAAEYKLQTRVREGYQYSEPTEDGRKGYGLVLDWGSMKLEAFEMETKARLNSSENVLDFSFTQATMTDKRFHERVLFYMFREGQFLESHSNGGLWYSMSAGVEPYLEQQVYRSETKSLVFESTLDDILGMDFSDMEEDTATVETENPGIHFGLRPRYSFAFGSRGKIINPFFSYATTPDELARGGMIVGIGPVVSKFALQSSLEDHYSLESGVILFDPESKKKLTNHHIATEKLIISPASGKLRALTNAQAELYSNISGLLLSGKLLNEDYMFRVVGGSDNAYLGLTYFGNYEEEMYGLGLLFGYKNFSAILEGGMSMLGEMYSQQLAASVGVELGDISIYLDLKAATWPLSKEAYDQGTQEGSWPVNRAMYYFNDEEDQTEDILGTLSIKGIFREEVIFEYLSRWITPPKVEKKRLINDLKI